MTLILIGRACHSHIPGTYVRMRLFWPSGLHYPFGDKSLGVKTRMHVFLYRSAAIKGLIEDLCMIMVIMVNDPPGGSLPEGQQDEFTKTGNLQL